MFICIYVYIYIHICIYREICVCACVRVRAFMGGGVYTIHMYIWMYPAYTPEKGRAWDKTLHVEYAEQRRK